MAQLTIPDELDVQIQLAAERLGSTREDFIYQAISEHLEFQEASLTDAQVARLMQGAEQIKRGEVVSSEKVDLFFRDWLGELEAK